MYGCFLPKDGAVLRPTGGGCGAIRAAFWKEANGEVAGI